MTQVVCRYNLGLGLRSVDDNHLSRSFIPFSTSRFISWRSESVREGLLHKARDRVLSSSYCDRSGSERVAVALIGSISLISILLIIESYG